jgi:hypothetical protein
MKKITIFLFLMLLMASMSLVAQSNSFFATYKNLSLNFVTPANNGYILANTNFWGKTDSAGNITKAFTYSYGKAALYDAKPLAGNAIIMASVVGIDTLSLIKLDSNGSVVWANNYLFTGIHQISNVSIALSKYSGALWIIGNMYRNGQAVDAREYVMKVDSLGNPLLAKELELDSANGFAYSSTGRCLMVEGDKNSCYFAASAMPFEQPDNTFVFKTDSLLNVKWATGIGYGDPNSLIKDGENIDLSWTTPQNTGGPITTKPSINLIQVDSGGTSAASLVFNITYFGSANCIQLMPDNGITMAGFIAFSFGIPKELAIRIDQNWNVKWAKIYGQLKNINTYEEFEYIASTKDKGLIMAGSDLVKTDSNGVSGGCNDSVYKYNSTLTSMKLSNSIQLFVDTLHVAYSPATIVQKTFTDSLTYYCDALTVGIAPVPVALASVDVFPNPSNGIFTIAKQNIAGKVNMFVYNMLGEKVFEDKLVQLNTQLNLTGQPSGVYLYRIISETGSYITSGKLVIEE